MEETEKRPGILIVDDNPDKITALESVISDLGEVVRALSGKEGLKHLLKREFAVILLDVNMPEMDGFETAELIRKRKKFENTPIIFVTAISQTEQAALKGYSLGAVDYIYSPVLAPVLRAKVKVFTDLFHMNEMIRKQSADLEAANNELSNKILEVERLNRDLAAVNKELEAFSYSAAHDLKAPLRSIGGFSKLVLEKYGTAIDATGKDYLNRIFAASERLTELIEDLLKFSRTVRSEMIKKNISVSDICIEVADELRQANPVRIMEFQIQEGMTATGDRNLIRVALENLMENAVKYSIKTPRAIIQVGKKDVDDESVFFVRDNGAGFDMAYVDKLFGVFQRLHSVKDFSGTGIGLALVARIIHRHGGRVWAEGEVGKGAVFYFTIPRS